MLRFFAELWYMQAEKRHGFMEIFTIILLFGIGLGLLVKGGGFFVDAAGWIAEKWGIPQFIIGATIVSIATSLPELLISVVATMGGQLEIAVGNAVGSVITDVGLIMGISLSFLPLQISRRTLFFKSFLMLSSCALLALFVSDGWLKEGASLLLLAFLLFFLMDNVLQARQSISFKELNFIINRWEKWVNGLKFLFGAACLAAGAQLLVRYGSALASVFSVPEGVIAVTLIAVGTSLPELVTTIIAVRKGEAALSIGNIVGSSIINLTLILPVCTMLAGGSLQISRQTIYLDLPVCVLVILLALLPVFLGRRFSHRQGKLLLLVYFIYLVMLYGII